MDPGIISIHFAAAASIFRSNSFMFLKLLQDLSFCSDQNYTSLNSELVLRIRTKNLQLFKCFWSGECCDGWILKFNLVLIIKVSNVEGRVEMR